MADPKIRIRRSSVPAKKPTIDQLQAGELAVNFYDGKLFIKQDQGGVGVGTRVIEVGAGSSVGKTIFVNKNGNNFNTGLSLNDAKATIGAAASIALSGDTIKVYPGYYVENNPVILPTNVVVQGTELRNCQITPQNTDKDLFHVNNAVHVTNLSFVGPGMTNGSAVIAFQPLSGVASDRFFDAARMIRMNLDYIASETVGFLTSGVYFSSPSAMTPFSMGFSTSRQCAEDIKSIFKAVCHDITRGGNSKCVGAGKSYYTQAGALQHIVGVKTETIDAIYYAAGIAKSCINNVPWTGNYQNQYTQVRDLSIQPDPSTGFGVSLSNCANVVSAIYSCVGVITSIIKNGLTILGAGINTTYPGNSGAGTTGPNDASFSPGVGPITQGPYIRNCTNFIANSIGMKVDGFHAEPGDQDDIGVTGTMSVDSFTQYNQGGIGVSITNGAYAQLVSIFTICDDIAIYTGNGGQCDITNSNSSFGNKGLVSIGVGGTDSGSVYRMTGETTVTSAEETDTVVVSGVGTYRPYDGQALYFGKLYYTVDSIIIDNPGEIGDYNPNSPPVITIDSATGPSGIRAEATADVSPDGKITGISVIATGSQYEFESPPNVSIAGTGSASATAVLQPIYYYVESATLPSAGISTITLKTVLDSEVGAGTTVYFNRQSLQIATTISFEYVGAGTNIFTAKPALGGVTIQENEVVFRDGGLVVYTSTDQAGNFRIGDGVAVNQFTGTITGRDFDQSLLNTVTPLIIALDQLG
jgi:hypothetical protein